MEVKFNQFTCHIEQKFYENGNTALELWDDEGPVAVATVSMGKKLPKDQAYVKDYSENEGMLEALMEAGIVLEILGFERTGFVTVPLCRLNMELIGT